MRITLIHNPGAGRQGRDGKAQLLELLEGEGHAVRYQSAHDQGWEDALGDDADLVAVAGGDGTVGRVATRMLGRAFPSRRCRRARRTTFRAASGSSSAPSRSWCAPGPRRGA